MKKDKNYNCLILFISHGKVKFMIYLEKEIQDKVIIQKEVMIQRVLKQVKQIIILHLIIKLI